MLVPVLELTCKWKTCFVEETSTSGPLLVLSQCQRWCGDIYSSLSLGDSTSLGLGDWKTNRMDPTLRASNDSYLRGSQGNFRARSRRDPRLALRDARDQTTVHSATRHWTSFNPAILHSFSCQISPQAQQESQPVQTSFPRPCCEH